MKNQRIMRVLGYLVVIATCLSGSALAQSPERIDQVAAVAADRTDVRWQPKVEYGRLILTVSSPSGEVFRKEFESGAVPTFKLTDSNGYSVADGQYNYELRVIPNLSKEVKDALAASREKGNSAEVIQDLQSKGQLPTSVTVQSGAFRLEKGAVFVGAPEEGAEPQRPAGAGASGAQVQSKKSGGGDFSIQTQVIAMDLIVQGSTCVGFDCLSSESFGFDTIRLKENNNRIKFDDTSTAGGFPANDWQLTANDSASGGANKFSIEDISGAKVPFTLTAGAPTNSVFVNSSGRLGLGTATPVVDIHRVTGNTPTLRLDQDGSSGFTPQVWDIAGNETNFFVRDVTGGSRLPLRIRPGAPTSSIDVAGSGNVGFGTQSPQALLHASKTTAGVQEILRLNNPSDSPAATVDVQFRVGSVDSAKGLIRNGFDGANFFLGFGAGNPATSNQLRILSNGNVGIGTITPQGTLDVNGTIFQRGVLLHADYVFEPAYTLESIEDHSAFMWNNKHLPALGPRKVDENGQEVVEIGARMRGMLEELEKAHIYISTLGERITAKDAALAKLERQNAELAERLARIEALLSASQSAKK